MNHLKKKPTHIASTFYFLQMHKANAEKKELCVKPGSSPQKVLN
jgi:acetylglutamate synthase